ncbi:MAG: bifunctional phosphoribosylaminoimidazolecarboxamide formyltransferase/IMP cyclohydrolase, partial [Planctomycetota bacterium]
MQEEPVRRALISVYDKEGIVDLCQALQDLDIEIVSSGGTARLLGENGIAVTRVADYTGSPEMLDGRVKTLHPRIHAGILAVRSNAEHMEDLRRAEIATIDLVVVNLYPFQKTAAIEGIGLSEVVEMIDIGGPAMVRAAAKSFAHVGVVVRPEDYAGVIDELQRTGVLSAPTRHRLSVTAFRHTAAYDNAVYSYLERIKADGKPGDGDTGFPGNLQLDLVKAQDLRYGENPHQQAAYYREPLSAASFAGRAGQLQGSACVIVKHGNPCGAALGGEPLTAFSRALECDALSAFGGVIAFNRHVDGRAAAKIAEQFYEGVIAPGFDAEARQALAKKKKLRLLEVGE